VVAALQQETRTIPIVFVHVTDPVGEGFVLSLARPGGNLTGTQLFEASITGKWLIMLKEIAPHLTRAAIVLNPRTGPSHDYFLAEAKPAAATLAMQVLLTAIGSTADEIEGAIADFAKLPNGGLVFPPDSNTTAHRDLLITLAARYHLPAVYSDGTFVRAGGLICYSTDRVAQFRLAASYVDRILRGAKPGDLPVQVPTKYETVLNLKAAKALGLTVPPSLLVAADVVIE
jgi:putative ABC transport system substrate-binding protein